MLRILRTCFKNCNAARLLRCAVLEILMYVQYTPVSALRAPCTRTTRDAFKTRSQDQLVEISNDPGGYVLFL